MGEPGNVRQARYKAHSRGDHSACKVGHCPHARVGPPAGASPSLTVEDGLTAAVTTFVNSLKFGPGDPRGLDGQIAVRLARLFDEQGSIAAVRELRVILSQISELPGQAWGPLDEIRVRSHQRSLDALLAGAEQAAQLRQGG